MNANDSDHSDFIVNAAENKQSMGKRTHFLRITNIHRIRLHGRTSCVHNYYHRTYKYVSHFLDFDLCDSMDADHIPDGMYRGNGWKKKL